MAVIRLKGFQRGSIWSALLPVLLILVMWAPVYAQGQGRKRPFSSGEGRMGMEQKKPVLTEEELARDIVFYITKDSALKGGYFLVYDQKEKKPLVLTFVKVHDGKLSEVEKGVYFVCVDFKTPEGALYDIDIFMKEGRETMEADNITIHKAEGKPRYTWVEKEGVWIQETVKSEQEKDNITP